MRRSVYIGTEGEQELAAQVLKATIEAHSRNVEVRFLNHEMSAAGIAIDNSVNSNTSFSKQRVFVPKLAGSGQAAYLDSDMLVFRDINELFDAAADAPIASCQTRQRIREPQTSVTVFDVGQCQWDPKAVIAEIDQDPAKYRPYLYEFQFAGGTQRILPPNWNDLEDYDPGSTCLLHFTDMETQPWLSTTNRLVDVWLDSFKIAVESGKVSVTSLVDAVTACEVRPSLLWQVRHGWKSAGEIPLGRRLIDVLFYVPPHTLANGIPFGLGALATRIVKSRLPGFLKRATLFVSSLALLARRRRRLLVTAALRNKSCLINRHVERVLDRQDTRPDQFSHLRP